MRRIIERPSTGGVCWEALRGVDPFLFRNVGDKGRRVLGAGVHMELPQPDFLPDGRVPDWVFGMVSYERKNTLHGLESRHPAWSGHPVERWFVPRTVVEWVDGVVRIHLHPDHESEGLQLARDLLAGGTSASPGTWGTWSPGTDRRTYLERVAFLIGHIQRGDIYEVNYCTARTATSALRDPYTAFGRLLHRTQAPFAAFYRDGPRHVLCASPERFIAFDGRRVTGEPMKGTRPRSRDAVRDAQLAEELRTDPKERAENVMALDVMRNDFSRVAASSSVTVDELCVVRSYPAVHQMVSTVHAVLATGRSPYDALLASFPMASMTGAPKVSAMKLIDEAEDQARGLFSGTLGFFAPDGTGDMNVVIRTVFHDQDEGTASLLTGSAITAQCDPECEYEECEVKARSVIDALRDD